MKMLILSIACVKIIYVPPWPSVILCVFDFKLTFILREIHPGFLNSRFVSFGNSFLKAVVSLIIRHMI